MKLMFKSAELPCNNLEDFNTSDVSMDIICRVYLAEAPTKEHEEIVKKIDKDFYDKTCFYIECVVGKNEPDGEFLSSGWLLYYVYEDGSIEEFDFIEFDNDREAIDFFKNEMKIDVEIC